MTQTRTSSGAPRGLVAFLRQGRATGADDAGQRRRAVAKRFWTVQRAIALAMMLLVSMVGLFGAAAANAEGEEDVMKYSFYNISSSMTAFFSTVQDPDSEDRQFGDSWKKVLDDPGSAGSMLGYADSSFSSVSGWLASGLSGSSDAIGYDTLLIQKDGGSSAASDTYQGMVDYAYFGAALKGLGLDGTSTGLSLGFMNYLSGGVVMLLYILSGVTDFLFASAIKVLDFLNPFKLFYVGVAAISPNFAQGMVGGSTGDLPAGLSGLASWIGGWYKVLNSMAWAVLVPLFIAVLVFSLFLFKKMDRGGAVKKILVRMMFIGLGLPLLGSMYTGMLSSMEAGAGSGNAGSTRAVLSTYVDFESWVMKNRLAIPRGAVIAWDGQAGQPTDKAQANVRNTALAINNQSMGLGMPPIVSAGNYDASWSDQVMQDREVASPSSAFFATVDMLGRFSTNTQVSAAAFETATKGTLTQSDFYKGQGQIVKNWFESLSNDAQGLSELDGDASSKELSPWLNPLIAVQAGQGLRGSSDGDGGRQFTTAGNTCRSSSALQITAGSAGAPRACNLAPLAMYNYLNTDFGAKSMTMYSSQNAQSEATRSIHNSVNQVGTGTMGFLYWLNTVVLLGSFVLIGIGYAFSMIMSSIRRSFQIMTAVPFATLGAISAIAKVVVYTVALILEVVVTIFVYTIVQEFLLSLPQIIEMPFAGVLQAGSAGALSGFVGFLVGGWGFGLVITVLSIVGVVLFTIMAMRVRKTFVKAVEEAVTKLVEKFMDTQMGMPGGGKLAPALAGSMASGAGSALSNRVLSGGMKAKGPNTAASQGPGAEAEGPGPIKTAGGTAFVGAQSSESTGGRAGVEGRGPKALEAGATGNGDPGSPAGVKSPGGAGGTASDEVALGRSVEINGLSKPESESADTQAQQAQSSQQADSSQQAESSQHAQSTQQGGEDSMSSVSDSVDKSVEGYQEADIKRLEAGKEAAKAAGYASLASSKAAAGDTAGAAESGGEALQSGGKAVAAGEEAQRKESEAGYSSLDQPEHARTEKASKGEQLSQAGAAVSGAAGTAKAGSGSAGQAEQAAEAVKARKQVRAGEPSKNGTPAASGASAGSAGLGPTASVGQGAPGVGAVGAVGAAKSAPRGPKNPRPSAAPPRSSQTAKGSGQGPAGSTRPTATGSTRSTPTAPRSTPTGGSTRPTATAPRPTGTGSTRSTPTAPRSTPTGGSTRPTATVPRSTPTGGSTRSAAAGAGPASGAGTVRAPSPTRTPAPPAPAASKSTAQSATRAPGTQVRGPGPSSGRPVQAPQPTQRPVQASQPTQRPVQAPQPKPSANRVPRPARTPKGRTPGSDQL